MHIQTCLNPKLIRHPKTHEQLYVPCGTCAACLRARSQRWVERLTQERYCWKYCMFWTLTYDNEHLPLLKFVGGSFDDNLTLVGTHLVDIHHSCTPPDSDVLVIDIDECMHQFSSDFSKDWTWIRNKTAQIGGIPVLSSYHLQKFIKRFRTNAKREFQKYKKSLPIASKGDDIQFRYFAIGELGETLLRPHYHGLFFFNSEFLANTCALLLSKSWKFGITDISVVERSNASYVAEYLNCSAHLPSIYRHRSIRPFFICSKFPPIGTLCHSSQEVQELFISASPDHVIFDHSKGIFTNAPLWRTYVDRLFPKLSSFDEISHIDRVALYRIVSEKGFTSFAHFYAFCTSSLYASARRSVIDDYVTYIRANCNNEIAAFQRWYYISSRVARQAQVFGVSIPFYVSQIEKFYQNVEKDKLKRYYEFQSEFSDNYGSASLVGCDELYLKSLMDLDVCDVSYEDLCILSSYGVDVEKFFSDDESVRLPYQKTLLPKNTWDFHVFELDSENWLTRSSKTKKKNDYLAEHPEYRNVIY